MQIDEAPGFVAFDLETTGKWRERDRIVTAFVGVVNHSGEVVSYRNWLIAPQIPIHPEAAKVHGISDEKARAEGMAPSLGVPQIIQELTRSTEDGSPVVGFNLAFDLTMLDREARRLAIPAFQPTRVIDPFVIDKRLDKYRKGSRKLVAVAEHYGIPPFDAHDAAADAIATAQVAIAVVRRYGGTTVTFGRGAGAERIDVPADLDGLHQAQIRWYRESGESLQEYWRSKGKTDTVDLDWPMAPFPYLGQVA